MKKVITKYYCDCCQKEVENENQLEEVRIPVPYFSEREEKLCSTIVNFHLCEDCLKKIENKLQEVAIFKEVRYEGKSINGVIIEN